MQPRQRRGEALVVAGLPTKQEAKMKLRSTTHRRGSKTTPR